MNIFLIGIKGTGMSHLAAYLKMRGESVSGCDVSEDFYTSRLLDGIDILSLDSDLPEAVDEVICTSAYEKRSLKALESARERSLPVHTYPEYLAKLSKEMPSCGIAGTHGKSTTCAVSAYIMRELSLSGGAVYGSFLSSGAPVVNNGNGFLVLEACEYQNHFLLYDLDVLVITNIAYDHPDFFPSLEDVRESFRQRVLSMKRGAVVIYHSSVSRLAENWKAERPDILFIKYASGVFSIVRGVEGYALSGGQGRSFRSENRNIDILTDYLAALMATHAIDLIAAGESVTEDKLISLVDESLPLLSSFPSLAARCELVRQEGGVKYIDDYAHHPDEIKVCLDNLRKRYPSSRLVVLFMPHTASRTIALMKEFVRALSQADAVFIQPSFASARGDVQKQDPALELATLLDKRVMRSFYGRLSATAFVPDEESAAMVTSAFLQDGDVCITMGAGDNRSLVDRIIELKDLR